MIDVVLQIALVSLVVTGELSRQVWEVLDVSEELAVESTLYMEFYGSDYGPPTSKYAA